MRGKRLTALLLAVLMTMTLFPAASAAAPESVVMPNITYATDTDAFVKNVSISQSKAWNLIVKADLTNAGNVYAVVMHYDDFDAQYNDNGTIGNILPSNYNALEGVSKKSYYYHQSTSGASQGTAQTLLDKMTFSFSSTIGESSTTYHQHYALILFDGGTTVQDLSDYTIADFYMDSQGKLQTQSYMLRYCANNGSAGASKANAANLPKYQIEGWGTDAAVAGTSTAQNPTRKGYTFVGWTDKTHKNAMGDDANKAAALEVPTENVLFAREAVTTSLGWDTVSGEAPGFGTTSYDRAKDQFFDLYALWRPVPVTLASLDQAAGAEKQTTTAKVGVTFAWKYEAGGSYDDSAPRDHGGNTTRIITAQYSEDGGTTWKTGLPAGLGLANGKQDRAMTYSSLNVQATNADATPEFLITGQPTQYSKVPITIRLTATDQSNGTTATQDLVLSEIQKGDQKVQPDEDVNTGLETRVDPIEPETPDTPESMEATTGDGVLYGFYSKGQTDAKANGTGSLRNYYLDVKGTSAAWNEALVYEYKPAEAADLPDNWREVPLPKELYSTDQLAMVQPTMALNAKTRCASTYAASGMTVTDSTPGNDVAPWAGWPESYGEIHFRADGAPEIHGLTVGGQYEVRFKENSDYGASAAKTFTITAGGGSSSGPTGSSLVFNLMGGKLYRTENSGTENEPVLNDVVIDKDHQDFLFNAMTAPGANDELTIPQLPDGWSLKKEGYTFGGFSDGETTYQPGDLYTLPGYSVALAAVWTGGAASPADFRSVTLLDWNDAIVGTAVIHKAATGLEIKESVDILTAAMYNGDLSAIAEENYLSAETWTKENPESAVLTAKKGYNFVGWVDTTAETMADTWTAFADLTEYTPSAALTAETPPENGWGNLYLKAGYAENTMCNAGSGGYYYTVSEISYNRVGRSSTNSFSVSGIIHRANQAKSGVTRLKEPSLRIEFSDGTNNLYFLQALDDGRDEINFEIVAPGTMEYVKFVVIDQAAGAWFTVGQAAQDKTEPRSVYVTEGSVAFINYHGRLAAQAEIDGLPTPSSWAQEVDATVLSDAGLKTATGGNITSRNMAAVKTAILEAIKTALSDGTKLPLTQTELQDAING